MNSWRQFLLLLGILMFAAGCAGPKIVTQISSRGDQAKFGYHQQLFLTSDQGIIQCEVPDEGDLRGCREIPIEFVD